MSLVFKTTREESLLIERIARRAQNLALDAGALTRREEWVMDLTATHNGACPLRLAELAKAPPPDFAHDVFGIRRHLDRKTGMLGGCFVPRYAAPEDA